MKLVEKGKDGAESVHMSWDAGMAALASGAYDPVPLDGDRDVDLPGAQAPAPGTDPKDGRETAAEGHVLTNLTPVAAPDTVSDGLPKAPPPPDPAPVKNPAPPAPVPAAPAAPAPAPTTKPAARTSMSGSFFDALFAVAPRAILDGAFGQPWQILPQAKASANMPVAPDASRPVITGIVGIFSDKTEMYRATHVYDQQAAKRPGITTAEITVEFADTFDGVPIDLRAGDAVVRLADGAQWRVETVRRDEATSRLTCALGRLS